MQMTILLFCGWRFKWCYIEIAKRFKNTLQMVQWNLMKANPDRCHFICSSSVKTSVMLENKQIRNSSCEKLLGGLFDSKLTSQSHIDNICKKPSQKLNAISRITPNMDFNKKKISCKCFFHRPIQLLLIKWMWNNRAYNNKINRLHERCLRLISSISNSQEIFASLREILIPGGKLGVGQ